MSTPEPHPYRQLNYPINNLEQSFTQEQKLQTRSNIGIPSSVDEEGKVLMVDNAAGELVWAEAPNGLPDIASGDEGKFLSVENGEPAWTDVDIPEQVNADWDATSGVQEILNKPNLSTVATTGQYEDLLGKPDIPASTSELVNDSDFITASEAPVQDVKVDGSSVVDGNGVANISIPQFQQLNSDWDATSGVQEILHRPDVKPLVAGSNITITETPSSVEISGVASAQQNADWDAVSGVSEILNKPDLSIYAETSDLATVATTGSYNDLVDRPSIPSAQVNADWDASSGVSAILNKPNLATVATTGDYSDLQNLPSIPAAQVNSDWSATSGISEILNKPTVKQVVAGANITITETANSFEISSTGGVSQVNADWDATSGVAEILNKPAIRNVPAVTSSDDGKVLKATYSGGSGSYSWETETGAAYTAGDAIDITNNEISVDYDTNTLDVVGQTVTETVTQQSSSDLFLLPSSVAALLSQQTNTQVTVHIPANTLRDYNFDLSDDPSLTYRFTLYATDSTSETNVSLFSTALSWENYNYEYVLIEEQDIVIDLPATVSNQWSQALSSAVAFSICGQKYSAPATSAPVELFGNLSTNPITFTFVDASSTNLAVKNPLPASTSADEGKCLVVDSNGDPEWGTGGKTYTGTDGVVVDNVNDTVGLEAPVDIVAGPGIVIDNPDGNTLRVSQSTFGAWENITDQFTWASNATDNGVRCLYNTTLKLLWMQGYVHLNVGTSSTKVCTLPSSMKTQLRITELSMASTLEEKHGLLSTNNDRTELHFKWVTVPSNKYVGFFLICPMEEV